MAGQFLGTFIPSQSIRRLRVPDGEESRLLEWFQGRGVSPVSQSSQIDGLENEFSEAVAESDSNRSLDLSIGTRQRATENLDRYWPMELDRVKFLADLSYRRICFSVEGGIGKSIIVRQLEVVTQQKNPGHLVMWFEMKDVPATTREFTKDPRRIGDKVLQPLLIEVALERFENISRISDTGSKRESSVPTKEQIPSFVESLLRRGDVTLIFDGIDQIPITNARNSAAVIRKFLELYPRVRCVIAGRPFSIQEIWDAEDGLHLGELANQRFGGGRPVWEFVRIERYTQEETREYLGGQKLAAAEHLDLDEIRVPRTANVVRQIPISILRQMESNSDLYFYTQFESLRESIKRHRSTHQCPLDASQIMMVVSGVAFGLWTWKPSPVMYAPLSEASDDSFQHFREYLDTIGISARLAKQNIALDDALNLLAAINTDAIRSDFYDPNGQGVQAVEVSDATIRDFYAAYWAANFLNRDDVNMNSRAVWKIQQSAMAFKMSKVFAYSTGKDVNPLCQPMWKLLIDSRSRKFKESHPYPANELSWVRAVEPLFATPPFASARPTELMYWAWIGMLEWSGKLSGKSKSVTQFLQRCGYSSDEMKNHDLDERELAIQCVTSDAQKTVRKQFDDGEIASQPIQVRTANELTQKFLTEFLKIVASDNLIARKFDCGFRDIPAGPFRYGDDGSEIRTIKSPFQLNQYQVTNELYDLFDQHHRIGFDNYERYSPYPRGAANYKTWMDSWVFSLWTHGRLPTETEWEAACRGKVGQLNLPHTMYYFGNDEADVIQCGWIYKNSTQTKDGQTGGRHIHEVGLFVSPPFEHPYRLFDMHGNVWEWCDNLYGEGDVWKGVSRSLRGGSFYFNAIYARCSFRDRYDPMSAVSDYGFRVARA